MNTYDEKLEAKKQRYLKLAEKHRAESSARYELAKEMQSVIPFGQPILVGHHSERGDRNYRKRIAGNMDKFVEHSNTAEYYEQKAASVGKGGISSDDPEAVTKLEAKLYGMKKNHQFMKNANRALRKKDVAKGDAMLKEMGLDDFRIAELRTPTVMGHTGFAGFSLSNSNANIKSTERRLRELRSRPTETTEDVQDGIKIVRNVEANRIQLLFDGKPAAHIRKKLGRLGFRWSRRYMAWQRYLNQNGEAAVRYFFDWLKRENQGVK